MGGDRLAGAHRVHAFVRLSFHADRARSRCRAPRQVGAHRVDVRRQLRPLRDDDDVDVANGESGVRHDRRRARRAASGCWRPSTRHRCRENAGRCRRRRRRPGWRRSPRGRPRRRPNGRRALARTESSRRPGSAAARQPGDAGRSRCRSAASPHRRPAAAEQTLGRREIVRGRDLQVARIAVDQVDGMSGPLGERRFVGGIVDAAASASASRSTSMRNACGVCARKISSRGSVSTMHRVRVASLDRIGWRKRRDRRAVLARRHRPCGRSDLHDDERPRGVMNDDDVRRARHARKRVGDRILPPLAALDDLHRLATVAQVVRHAGGQVGRQRDDDVGDAVAAKGRRRRCAAGWGGRRASGTASAARRRSGRRGPPAAMMASHVHCQSFDSYVRIGPSLVSQSLARSCS